VGDCIERRLATGLVLITTFLGLWPPRARAAAPRGAVAGWQVVARTVRDRLEEDALLAHDQIDVDVSGLLLTLTGVVGSQKERRRALEIARGTAPPHTMVNDTLRIVPTEPPAPGPGRAASYRFSRGPGQPARR
jgi:hypothetical protein